MVKRISLVAGIVVMFFSIGLVMAEEGLVLHYTFDEGSGTVAKDGSGNNNDGKIHGAEYVECRDGHALKFDGKDDYVDCGNAPSLNIKGAITIEAWIKTDDVGKKYQSIVNKGWPPAKPPVYWLFLAKNQIRFQIINSNEKSSNAKFAGAQNNVWYHVVAAWKSGESVRLYVNKVCYRHKVLRTSAIADPAKAVNIGRITHGTNYFKGLIDEVKIYNRVLPGEEIWKHYEEGAKGREERSVTIDDFEKGKVTFGRYEGANWSAKIIEDKERNSKVLCANIHDAAPYIALTRKLPEEQMHRLAEIESISFWCFSNSKATDKRSFTLRLRGEPGYPKGKTINYDISEKVIPNKWNYVSVPAAKWDKTTGNLLPDSRIKEITFLTSGKEGAYSFMLDDLKINSRVEFAYTPRIRELTKDDLFKVFLIKQNAACHYNFEEIIESLPGKKKLNIGLLGGYIYLSIPFPGLRKNSSPMI